MPWILSSPLRSHARSCWARLGRNSILGRWFVSGYLVLQVSAKGMTVAEPNTTCPECKGRMDVGFILDLTYGGRLASSWVEGRPEKRILLGLKLTGKRVIEIETYRCSACG